MHAPNRAAAALLSTLCLVLVAATAAAETPMTIFAENGEAKSRRIIIVPLNLGVRATPEVAAGIEPVWQQVLKHFRTQDVPVAALERKSATALWNEVMAEAKAEDETSDVYEVYGRFARRIADQIDCGAIVFPSLVVRVAKVSGRSASWDGVSRYLSLPGADFEQVDAFPEGGIKVTRLGVNGEMAAASLHVAVTTPDGELRYEGAGGLALLQRLVEGRDKEMERIAANDAWSDAEELLEGVETAFRKPLPASRAR